MLYLSSLVVDGRSREAQSDLSDCHAMHRRLLLAFPNLGGLPAARDHFGILYRLETGDGGAVVLVQSSAEPDWSRIPDGYLRDAMPLVKRIDQLYATITEGRRLHFRLRANPTRRISNRDTTQDERWRGKRVELRREEDQVKWLARKGEQAGFSLITIRTQPDVNDVHTTGAADHVMGRRDSHRLTFASVTFEGRLQVINADAFRTALWRGIGSGKAFGFGLLSIAPIPE